MFPERRVGGAVLAPPAKHRASREAAFPMRLEHRMALGSWLRKGALGKGPGAEGGGWDAGGGSVRLLLGSSLPSSRSTGPRRRQAPGTHAGSLQRGLRRPCPLLDTTECLQVAPFQTTTESSGAPLPTQPLWGSASLGPTEHLGSST